MVKTENEKNLLSPVIPSSVSPSRALVREKLTPEKLGIQTLISRGAKFVGTFESNSGVKIDGHLTGNMVVNSETDAWVVIGESASVEGLIQARVVVVCGHIKGDINARHITLMPTAQIDGDLHYEAIRIAEGAQVNGRLNKTPYINAIPDVVVAVEIPDLTSQVRQINQPQLLQA